MLFLLLIEKNFPISVFLLHIGLNGYIVPQFDYRLLASVQRGWGNPYVPFTDIRKEFSGMLEVNYRPRQLGSWRFDAGIAGDAGTQFGNNWGKQFGVTKSGKLFFTFQIQERQIRNGFASLVFP